MMEIAGKMLTLETAQTTLTGLAVLAGGGASYLWYRASVVVVYQGDPKDVPGYYLGNTPSLGQKGGKADQRAGDVCRRISPKSERRHREVNENRTSFV